MTTIGDNQDARAIRDGARRDALDQRWRDAEDAAHGKATAALDGKFAIFLKALALLAGLFGREAATAMLHAFLRVLRRADSATHFPVEEISLEDAKRFLTCAHLETHLGYDLRALPAYTSSRALALYADRGVAPPDLDRQEGSRRSALSRWADTVRTAAARVPRRWRSKATAFLALSAAAEARARIVSGEPAALDGLAALTGLTVRRVQNIAADKRRTLRLPQRDGFVPAPNAVAWLRNEHGFMFHELGDDEEDVEIDGPAPVPAQRADAFHIYLPVDRHGNVFTPACRGPRGYKVGLRDEPYYANTFRDALDWLRSMDVPVWRRLRDNGTWAIANGVGWEPYTPEEVEAMFAGSNEPFPWPTAART